MFKHKKKQNQTENKAKQRKKQTIKENTRREQIYRDLLGNVQYLVEENQYLLVRYFFVWFGSLSNCESDEFQLGYHSRF